MKKMFEDITEVIGFDLGYEETALTCLQLDGLDKYSEPIPIEVFKRKNPITAIGYHPTKGTLIGELALRTSGVTEFHTAFIRRPNNDSVYQRVMHDFIKTIYDYLVDQEKLERDKTLFIVGCPFSWIKDETVVKAYEQLFSQAGIPHVVVIAESQALLMHAIESSRLFNWNESKGLVLVIEVKSFTTSFTLFYLKDKKIIPFNVGYDLGASLIDKKILQWVLRQHPNKEELEKIFEDYPHFRNRCELVCRKAKQEYFSAPELYQEEGDYAPGGAENIRGRYLFMPQLDGNVMGEILCSPIVELDGDLKSWPDAFEIGLEKLRQRLKRSENPSPDVILLTGGASRMNFVPEICQKVFPQATIKVDDNPEFCVAKGLARWGRAMQEVKTAQNKEMEGTTVVSWHPEFIDTFSEMSTPDVKGNC